MPNHIQNRLKISGEDAEVQRVIEFLRSVDNEGNEMRIDFNKIKPMPKELEIESDGWTMILDNSFSVNEPLKKHLDKMREFYANNHERKVGQVKNFLAAVSNYIEHGHATWYTWSNENWGTKWNAYNQPDKRDTENTIHFQTAWASPVELIRELSKMFPTVKVELKYASEDSGCNTGHYIFQEGHTIHHPRWGNESDGAWTMFFELWPGRKEDYELKDGKYQHTES